MAFPERSEFTEAFLTAIARYLHDQGVGVYRPTGAYAADETAIVLGELPQSPDRVIALTPYGVSDAATSEDDVIGLQARTRGTAAPWTSVLSIDDDVFDALHSLHEVTLPADGGLEVRVTQIFRTSYGSLGFDESRRRENSHNFYCTVWRPSSHRP